MIRSSVPLTWPPTSRSEPTPTATAVPTPDSRDNAPMNTPSAVLTRMDSRQNA